MRYKPGSGPLDYWVAYQCAYALRFYALPPNLRFDFTDTGDGPGQVATLLTGGQSLPAADLERVPMFAHKVEQWALMTLLSYPVGMRVDQWLHDDFPALRDVQREGMHQIQQENLQLLSMAMGRLTVPVVEQAEKARTRLAHKGLQEGAVGGLRLDVVAYITDALRTFDKVGPKDMQGIAAKVRTDQ